MAFMESFILGPFSVDPEGRLSLAARMFHPGSASGGEGRVVHARLDAERRPATGICIIRSSLGRIPSTASDPATRVACFTMLQNLLSALPDDWSARLLPDHQPQLEVETLITLPITVTNLVTELTISCSVSPPISISWIRRVLGSWRRYLSRSTDGVLRSRGGYPLVARSQHKFTDAGSFSRRGLGGGSPRSFGRRRRAIGP